MSTGNLISQNHIEHKQYYEYDVIVGSFQQKIMEYTYFDRLRSENHNFCHYSMANTLQIMLFSMFLSLKSEQFLYVLLDMCQSNRCAALKYAALSFIPTEKWALILFYVDFLCVFMRQPLDIAMCPRATPLHSYPSGINEVSHLIPLKNTHKNECTMKENNNNSTIYNRKKSAYELIFFLRFLNLDEGEKMKGCRRFSLIQE